MIPLKKSENITGRIRKKRSLVTFISLVFSLALLNMMFSCSYFKVSEIESHSDSNKQQQIKKFNQEQKYIVVHQNEKQYHLDDLNLDTEEQILAGKLVNLNKNHQHPKDPNVKIGKTYRYNKGKTDPLNEIHIYLNNNFDLEQNTNISIPISEIDRIAVVDKNVGKTIISIVGSTIGILAVAIIIIALTKSSCPFVYSYDGEAYVFNGELYPGNIIRNAQNQDYLKLNNFCEKDGFYQVRVSNELLEIQHTDLVELLFFDHPAGTEVLLDPSGKPVLLENNILPKQALSHGKSVINLITVKGDEQHFTFNNISEEEDYLSNLILKFPKPIQAKNAGLKLTIKNSMWLDYIFGSFNEKFGAYYNSFQKQQQDFTLEKSRNWQESQHIPLSVYVKRKSHWELEEKIFSTGPMSFRDIGLEINVENIQTDYIEIKLESGFMFWEIDHAALSFQSPSQIEMQSISAFKAITEKGVEVSDLLKKNDAKYLTQKKPGEFVDIYYLAPIISKGTERSIFIKSKGYYNYIRDYNGIPDFKELIKFKNPAHFTKFSKDQFEQINKSWNMNKYEDYAL